MSIQTLNARVQYLGGSQLGRINKSKLESFRWACRNDYNCRMIRVNETVWPCLINSRSGGLKPDYDKKYVSVEFDSGLTAGDTFEILDDNSHWMIYLQFIIVFFFFSSEFIIFCYDF